MALTALTLYPVLFISCVIRFFMFRLATQYAWHDKATNLEYPLTRYNYDHLLDYRKILINTKTPDFTFLGVKSGVYFVKHWFLMFIAVRTGCEHRSVMIHNDVYWHIESLWQTIGLVSLCVMVYHHISHNWDPDWDLPILTWQAVISVRHASYITKSRHDKPSYLIGKERLLKFLL